MIPDTRKKSGMPRTVKGFQDRIAEIELKVTEYRRLHWILIHNCRKVVGEENWAPPQKGPEDFRTVFEVPPEGVNDIPPLVFPEDKIPTEKIVDPVPTGPSAARNGAAKDARDVQEDTDADVEGEDEDIIEQKVEESADDGEESDEAEYDEGGEQ